MKRHILLALLRLLLAYGIAQSMWRAHAAWGERYPGDGQQAFGFILMFMGISFAAAIIYLLVGSSLQFLLRRRRACVTAICDAALFAVFTGVLVYAGVTAKYTDERPNKALQPTAAPPSVPEVTAVRERPVRSTAAAEAVAELGRWAHTPGL